MTIVGMVMKNWSMRQDGDVKKKSQALFKLVSNLCNLYSSWSMQIPVDLSIYVALFMELRLTLCSIYVISMRSVEHHSIHVIR